MSEGPITYNFGIRELEYYSTLHACIKETNYQ